MGYGGGSISTPIPALIYGDTEHLGDAGAVTWLISNVMHFIVVSEHAALYNDTDYLYTLRLYNDTEYL